MGRGNGRKKGEMPKKKSAAKKPSNSDVDNGSKGKQNNKRGNETEQIGSGTQKKLRMTTRSALSTNDNDNNERVDNMASNFFRANFVEDDQTVDITVEGMETEFVEDYVQQDRIDDRAEEGEIMDTANIEEEVMPVPTEIYAQASNNISCMDIDNNSECEVFFNEKSLKSMNTDRNNNAFVHVFNNQVEEQAKDNLEGFMNQVQDFIARSQRETAQMFQQQMLNYQQQQLQQQRQQFDILSGRITRGINEDKQAKQPNKEGDSQMVDKRNVIMRNPTNSEGNALVKNISPQSINSEITVYSMCTQSGPPPTPGPLTCSVNFSRREGFFKQWCHLSSSFSCHVIDFNQSQL